MGAQGASPPIRSRPMSEERLIFGANFRKARRAKKLSQRDVTAQIGLAQSYISEVETGQISIGIDSMAALAKLVGVPLWKLLKPAPHL